MPDDIGIEIVGKAGAGADRKTGNHCENCREGHGTDEGKEDITSQGTGKFGSRHVGASMTL